MVFFKQQTIITVHPPFTTTTFSERRPVVPSSPRAPCLMIQGRTLALFQPPAHIFAVRQFVAIEAVVPG